MAERNEHAASLLRVENDVNNFEYEEYEGIVESIDDHGRDIFICQVCGRHYKTRTGYQRHLNNEHSKVNEHVITGAEIYEIIREVKTELSEDLCYPITERNKWKTYTVLESESLISEIQRSYTKLTHSSNAEDFYEQYYATILYSSVLFLLGMELPESVELLRKTADRILRHYKQGKAVICDESAKNISEVEMDALEYLGGYVLHNLQIKFERNQDKNAIALQILNNFKSNTVEDQNLINLQNRGGLTGINSDAKIIFVKAEYLFRDFTIKNPHKVDCNVLLKMALTTDY